MEQNQIKHKSLKLEVNTELMQEKEYTSNTSLTIKQKRLVCVNDDVMNYSVKD